MRGLVHVAGRALQPRPEAGVGRGLRVGFLGCLLRGIFGPATPLTLIENLWGNLGAHKKANVVLGQF